MTTYNPHGLAVTLAQRAAEAQGLVDRLVKLATELEADSPYAHDHAEEQLEATETVLNSLAANLGYIAGQYTRTGIAAKQARGEWGA